jgi:hypothetical protein
MKFGVAKPALETPHWLRPAVAGFDIDKRERQNRSFDKHRTKTFFDTLKGNSNCV